MKTLNFTFITGVTTLRSFITQRVIGIISLLALSNIAYAIAAPTTVITTERNTPTMPIKWTGLYGGFNIGEVFNNVDLNSHNLGFINMNGTCNTNSNFSSFSPGIQLGYDHEYDSSVVLGLEGDVTYNTNQTDKLACNCPITPGVTDRFSFANQMQASIRGRLGYALDNHLLPFLTIGGSVANLRLKYSDNHGDSYFTNPTEAGWLIGAGLEWKFSPTWSMRAEYLYTAYGNVNMGIPNVYGLIDPNGHARAKLNTNSIRVVINYWY